MTGYSGFVLFIVAFYAAINFSRFYTATKKIFHFSLAAAALFLAIIGISGYLPEFFPVMNSEFIVEWATVFSVAFLLTGVAALIRDSKLLHTDFPKYLVFIPLLIIVVYPLVIEATVIKKLIIAIYQGGALMIGLLIYGYRASGKSEYGYLVVGLVFFAITYILYWLPQSVFSLPEYAWILLTASGILALTVGYNHIYNPVDELPDAVDRKENWFV